MRSFQQWWSVPVLCLGLGCGRGGTQPSARPAATASSGSAADVDAGVSALSNDPDAGPLAAEGAAPSAPAMGPVAIVAGTRREVPTPTPTVRVTAPRNGSTVRENRVELRLDVRNWRTVTDASDRRHVHVVLDNDPYIRVDDPSRPVVLENLTEGTHVARVFAGWETHESVKTPGAFAMVVFHVGRPTAPVTFDPRAPMLVYSRPKGTMTGRDCDHLLLDFYLVNVAAADMGAAGVRVRPTIDGRAYDPLTVWQPYFIDNLPDGEHTVVLELLGRDGSVVPGPFNRAERTITLNRRAAPPAAAPVAPADPHAGH